MELVTQNVWQRTLRPLDVRLVEQTEDFKVRVGLLTQFVAEEVRALSELDSGPDVVICAMSPRLEELCRTGIAEYESLNEAPGDNVDDDGLEEVDAPTIRSFRRGLKAACLHSLPTQLVWHRTLAGTRGVQDRASIAWNLTVALLYKA